MKIILWLAMIGSVVGGITMLRSNSKKSLDLRVAFPYDKPVSFYEPTQIHLAPEYIFLENTYSPLVEFSAKDGEVIPSVAESFEWNGDDLHLKIRGNLKTVSGNPITADDVEFSLKRLLVLSSNTHGNFRDLVCEDKPIKNVDENCAGIKKLGNTIILKAGKRKAFLIPMLAAIDFAIIPRSSVDEKTLKITNYKETSGPYYVSEDDGKGHVTLKANTSHFRYRAEMPQSIYLIPTDTKNSTASLKDFKEGKVDFITTIDSARPEEIIKLSREIGGTTLHTTMKIRSFVLTFTKRGLAELSARERRLIGKTVKNAFIQQFKNMPGYEITDQFFPAFGEGGLKEEVIDPIVEKMNESEGKIIKPLKVAIVRIGDKESFEKMLNPLFKDIAIEMSGPPEFTKYAHPEDEPHFFLAGPDTGFLEDIGLISYSLSAGLFGKNKSEREKWLGNYMSTSSKEERLQKLRDLHKEVLSNPVIVPMMVAPYTALARGSWSIDLPQYFANNPLWLLTAK